MDIKLPPLNLTADQWATMALPERMLMIAAQECDVYKAQEQPKGSNRGPRVDTYLRSAQSFPGQPWCAALITFCLQQAGWDPRGKVMYPAAVASWAQWAKKTGRLVQVPKRGCLGFLSGEGRSHIFAVTDAHILPATPEGPVVKTLEGNTNNDGSREGYEICRRVRAIAHIDGFITLEGLR